MKRFSSKKALVAVSATAALTLAGGAAFATSYLWNTTADTPSGSHPTATAQTETFSVVGSIDGTIRNLYPGGPGADIATTISNPNPYGLAITNAVFNGSITADSGHPGCNASSAHYAYASAVTVGSGTVASPTTATGSVGTLTLDATSASACQGATFTVPLTVTATQNSAS